MNSLNLESLESRTLLASLLDTEGDSADPMTDGNDAFETQDALVTNDHETSNDKKHSKHSFKHKLSSTAHKIKDGFEHTADKAFHTLKEGVKITGEAMRAVGDASPGKTQGDAAAATAELVAELIKFV